MRLLNIIFGISLLVIGTLLGDGYKNSLYLFWLISLAFLVLLGEFLLHKLQDSNAENEALKGKVTTLSILKGNGNNPIQISVFPKNKILKGQETQIDVYATCSIPLSITPDIKLFTDSEWDVLVSNQKVSGEKYAGKFEYVLSNSITNNTNNCYFKYSFFIKINNTGDQKYTIELKDETYKGSIVNNFKVNRN
ncbi:hypothetical protein [Cytobacillus purgationiresistens]|uniref:DUF58 domain-containing protein n=1 Tax=Cytobacillus purgationiresistens TaxID=863449 RepID=A0ABU0AD70_9BACI|nr:hypothetical protein [Cytobacillus purgationiresistens]MDQ0268671.1 hypothetical protein [Cytobacillus purgationiresistens]